MAPKSQNSKRGGEISFFKILLIASFTALISFSIYHSLDIEGTKFEDVVNVVSEEQLWLENLAQEEDSLDLMDENLEPKVAEISLSEQNDGDDDVGHDVYMLKNRAAEHRGLSSGLMGMRILYVICMFDLTKLREVERMIESAMDICISGAHLTIVIQTTDKADDVRFQLLRKKLQCNGSKGTLKLEIEVFSKAIGLDLSKKHRQVMYDRIDNFDLFIYSEDDMDIRPSTIAAYFAETIKLEAALPEMYSDNYPHQRYIISFIRWEQTKKRPKEFSKERLANVVGQPTRIFWENMPEEYSVIQLEGLARDRENIPYVTMNNPHTAMWILTKEQLIWLQDSCNFDNPDIIGGKNVIKRSDGTYEQFTVRVWVSTNQFAHCKLQRVIPLKALEALSVHHLPDANYKRKKDKSEMVLFSQELYSLLHKKASDQAFSNI